MLLKAYSQSSNIAAAPMPPPIHIDSIPYLTPFLRMLATRVANILEPVHPSGWPSAMAPPLMLILHIRGIGKPVFLVTDAELLRAVDGL